jgi:prepilin-type N-terminal cleavage/methylation domain-containing protein
MRRSRGFTLVEIVVVLLIFGIVLAMAAAITRGVVASQKRSLTATRIAAVDAALVQFVMQQRRLPCPADGTKASSDVNAGVEGVRNAGGCTGTQAGGVVPFRALALTEAEATDGWERRLTYRVDASLAADNGMDMSWCDPAGTESQLAGPRPSCNTGCASTALPSCTPPYSFLSGTASARGLRVRNLAGATLMNPVAGAYPPIPANTGAAYVVISSGESGGGGYLNSGTLSTSSTADGTEEQKNYANLPYVAGTTYYVDDTETASPHFDDVVSHPSILSIATKAGTAPRTH